MNASNVLAASSRWVARILGAVLVAISILIAVGEGVPNPLRQPLAIQVGFLALALVLAGIIVGWRRELAGGALSVAGWILFVVVTSATFRGPYYFIVLLAVPGVLFVVSALLRRRRHT